MNAILVSEAVLGEIARHAEEGYPHEIVGALVGVDRENRREITEARRFENTMQENRERRYTIEPKALMKLERELDAAGKSLLGFYHSHPDHPARPSPTDLEWAWPFYSYVIQSVVKGRAADVTSWRLPDEGKKEFFEEEIVKT